MNETTPQDIRKITIDAIESDYIKIYGLSEESASILRRNLSNMSDESLWKEMSLIEVFYDSSKRAYQKWFMEIIHFEENEEKTTLNPTLNF